ncbi:unnamed protein product [Paramecium primaurelia]|uniref:Tetratricopeptide repeat protein n=1 Tax=Paramecium primaurelia TaxID=5886 RepID=A0A8S1MT10_PARPR|nr:unnamed protein product [Paramecium primaurelia]
MDQNIELQIQCSIKEHDSHVQLVCINDACSANRVYCFQCLLNGYHADHLNDQYDLNKLIELFQNIEKQSESLIEKLNLMIGKINESLAQLNQGLKQKYQIKKQRLQKMNANQLNQALDQIVKYSENTKNLQECVEKYSNQLNNQLNAQIQELKLEQINYSQITQEQLLQAEEFYQKGIKVLKQGQLLYKNYNQYEEAIYYFDYALLNNKNHFLSLVMKADSLRMLGKYDEAILQADKALEIDSKHLNSLFTKCNYQLNVYECLVNMMMQFYGLIKRWKQIQSI